MVRTQSKIKLINNTVKYKDEYYRKIEAQEAIQAKIKAEMIQKMLVHGNDKLKAMMVKKTMSKIMVPESSKFARSDKITSRVYLIGVKVDPNG